MITLANGDRYDVRMCLISDSSGWLHIEFIRIDRDEVERIVSYPEALATIVYENGEYRKTYEGYVVVQRIEDTSVGIEVVLMRNEERDVPIYG